MWTARHRSLWKDCVILIGTQIRNRRCRVAVKLSVFFKGVHCGRSPGVLEEIRSAPRFGDCQRDGHAACNGAPAAYRPGSYRGGYHVQFDPLRKRQTDRSVAVPRVRLCPASSARSKGKADDVARSLLPKPPAAELSPQANPRGSAFSLPHGRDHSGLIAFAARKSQVTGLLSRRSCALQAVGCECNPSPPTGARDQKPSFTPSQLQRVVGRPVTIGERALRGQARPYSCR